MCKQIPLAIVYSCGRPLEGHDYQALLKQLDPGDVLTGWIRPYQGEPHAVLVKSESDFAQCWPDSTKFYAVIEDRLLQLQRA